jgi:hypothetical protein
MNNDDMTYIFDWFDPFNGAITEGTNVFEKSFYSRCNLIIHIFLKCNEKIIIEFSEFMKNCGAWELNNSFIISNSNRIKYQRNSICLTLLISISDWVSFRLLYLEISVGIQHVH